MESAQPDTATASIKAISSTWRRAATACLQFQPYDSIHVPRVAIVNKINILKPLYGSSYQRYIFITLALIYTNVSAYGKNKLRYGFLIAATRSDTQLDIAVIYQKNFIYMKLVCYIHDNEDALRVTIVVSFGAVSCFFC